MKYLMALCSVLGLALGAQASDLEIRSGVLPRGFVIPGKLERGEVDRYVVHAGAGEWISAAIVESGRGEFHDPMLAVFAPGATKPSATSDDGGPGFLPRLAVQADARGRWTIAVTGFGDADFDGSGHEEHMRYRLLLTIGSVSAGRPGRFPLLFVSRAQSGTLQPGAAELFEVQTLPGLTLHASVFEPEGGSFHDVVVRVRDANGVVLAQNDDGGPGFLANLSLKVPKPTGRGLTRLFVELTGFDPDPTDVRAHREEVDYVMAFSTTL